MIQDEILALVAGRSGMVFAPNRRVEAETGIARAMKRAGDGDRAAYLRRLHGDPGALDDLVDEVTVGETHFMRDPDQLELIRREILPALAVRRNAGGAPPRVWSAGCASGEEAYTLAILLEQCGLHEDAFVLGTDLSTSALARARAAAYSAWSMRGVSGEFLEAYFRPASRRRVVMSRLRERVHFGRLNLVGDEPYASAGAMAMDLVLCRNVLIYFDHETAGRIAARLFDALAPGGVLLTGGADLLLGGFAPFEVTVTPVGLVYRRPQAEAPPAPRAARPSPPLAATERLPPPPPLPAAPVAETPPSAPAPDLERDAFDRVTALANAKGAADAERVARASLRRHPLDARLHYLRATLLLTLGHEHEAEEATERALYLDRSLAVAHFFLGTLLRMRGERGAALRAFRNARNLCAELPADGEVPAGAGERVGALLSASAAEMAGLEPADA